MEQRDLQKLLLKTAVCTIACDGEIHEKEIAEMNAMVSQAVYFKDFNGIESLSEMLDAVKKSGKDFFHEFLEGLKSSELSIVQELLLLEVILRIVYADERFDTNEEMFLRLVRTHLHVHDEIITQRFGAVPCLNASQKMEFSSVGIDSEIVKISSFFDNVKLVSELSVDTPISYSATEDLEDMTKQ
ncbi:MAG: hypothetical protein A2X85_17440 [Geobacteraceae bacterium GWF2_54_21]|nr:MAG: hypothetical protein A2X85_17440 [Geobacteraceae bacterium GWF2_54_21]